MPKIAELKEFGGAMWARLDMDWNGGPISLYTDIEIEEIKRKDRAEIIYLIRNIDRAFVRDE